MLGVSVLLLVAIMDCQLQVGKSYIKTMACFTSAHEQQRS
jgi:hypothetical protein